MLMNRDPFPPVESSCWKFIESMMSYIEIIVFIIDLSAPFRGLSDLSRYHFFLYVVILPCTICNKAVCNNYFITEFCAEHRLPDL